MALQDLACSLQHIELAALDIYLDEVNRCKRPDFAFRVETCQVDSKLTVPRVLLPRSSALSTQRCLGEVVTRCGYRDRLRCVCGISQRLLEHSDIGNPGSAADSFVQRVDVGR